MTPGGAMSRVKTIAVLGVVTVEREVELRSYGETANRDYYTKVQPGTYLAELCEDTRTGRRYAAVTFPGLVRYVGPDLTETYEGRHTWTPRDYELAQALAQGSYLPAAGMVVEAGPGVEARPVSFYEAWPGGPTRTLWGLFLGEERLHW